jgi:cell division initiation protein
MYTPNELENIKFKSSVIGFDKNEVMEFVASIYGDYDKLYRDNIAIKDKNNLLAEAIKEYKTMEVALRDTVVSAHSISDEIKKNAYKEAENIIMDASNRKDELLNTTNKELDQIKIEIAKLKQEYAIYKSKIKGLIKAQLEILELEEEQN